MNSARTAAVLAFGFVMALGGCSFTVNGDDAVSHQFGSDYFGAGGILSVTDPIAGDAFLAGGQVSTAGEVDGDLIAAAGQVSVGGSVGDDLYAVGGDVKVDAMVHGNARVMGGDVAVGPATVIAGSATLTGGRVTFEGNSHGYLQASGGTVTIAGQVHEDAEVRAEDLVISPETQIGGRLVYYGPQAPAVPEGAVIVGGVEFHEVGPGSSLHERGGPMRQAVHWVGTVLWHAGVFCAGVLFMLLFPGASARAAEGVGRQPLPALGLGLAILVCVPVVAVALCITIIGIPLALLLVPAYLLTLFLGWIVAALFIGQRGVSLVRGTQPATTGWQMITLLVGLVALSLVCHVPFVGELVACLALIAGTGALVRQAWARRTPATAPGG